MKLETQLVKTPYGHYIPIPEKIAARALDKLGKRVLCIIKGKEELHCAIQKNSRIGYYISVGKNTKAKIKLDSDEIFGMEILEDKSKYQLEVPIEFKEVLNTDEEGLALFEKLTDGAKRSLIHYILSAKREETRINRSLKILENLKLGITKPMELIR